MCVCVCVWACEKQDSVLIFESQIKSMQVCHEADVLNDLMQRFTQESAETLNAALNPTGSLQHINRKLAAEANCGAKSIFFEASIVLSHDTEMIPWCDAIVCEHVGEGDCHSFTSHSLCAF